jgi:hypothetical protein
MCFECGHPADDHRMVRARPRIPVIYGRVRGFSVGTLVQIDGIVYRVTSSEVDADTRRGLIGVLGLCQICQRLDNRVWRRVLRWLLRWPVFTKPCA